MRPDWSKFLVYKYPDADQAKLMIVEPQFYEKEQEFNSDDEVYPGD